MKQYIFSLIIVLSSLPILASEENTYAIGSELMSEKHSSLVLFHYKNDAFRQYLNRDNFFFDFDWDFISTTVDTRDLYKIKKGDKIKLIESLRDGKVYKVELLKDFARRPHYFVESESLKHYNLIKPETDSG